MADEKLHQIDMKVNLMERDVEQLGRVQDRFWETIDKIQEVNANLAKMITLHEQRHEQHELVEDDVKEDVKELHSRITTVTRELHDKMDELEKNITFKIDSLRRELLLHEENDRQKVKVTNILREIDKYKYLILGGAVTAGWILGNVNIGLLSKFFK